MFVCVQVPHNESPSLIDTLSDPVKVRSWQIAGLPKDNLSVENGVVVQYSRRWPLFIDPQVTNRLYSIIYIPRTVNALMKDTYFYFIRFLVLANTVFCLPVFGILSS